MPSFAKLIQEMVAFATDLLKTRTFMRFVIVPLQKGNFENRNSQISCSLPVKPIFSALDDLLINENSASAFNYLDDFREKYGRFFVIELSSPMILCHERDFAIDDCFDSHTHSQNDKSF